MSTKVVRYAVLVAAGLNCMSAAAGTGNSPKGAPFIQLQDQIVEVQGAVSTLDEQIQAIVADVDTLEGRVDASQDAIVTLQAANSQLSALVYANATDLSSIQAAISGLQAENLALQQQMAASSGNVDALQAQVSANEALLLSLQSAVVAVQNGQLTLETDLQSQIDHNNLLISGLQGQIDDLSSLLELKQDHLNGQCGEGYALQAINPDGSIFCTSTGNSNIEMAYAQASVAGTYGQVKYATAYCAPGYIRTGGGFRVAYFVNIARMEHVGDDAIQVGAYTGDHVNNTIFAYAFCMRLSQ